MFQKKKEEIPEPTPLTVEDIQKLKEKLNIKDIHKNEEAEIKIKDISIGDLLPQCFDEVDVLIKEGEHILKFSDTFTGDKYRTFRKNKGGIFTKDSLDYHRGNEHGKYLLIEGNGERKIVRLIDDKELLLFQTLRLINGIIKDKPYMLLKKLGKGEKITGKLEYIKKNSEYEVIIDEEVMNINPVAIDIEDDPDFITSSISLFDD